MESNDHGAPMKVRETICALEWVVLAMDAARHDEEVEDGSRFRLDYSQIYTDELGGL